MDFLDGVVIAFAGADTQRGFDRDNENLAVTNAASLGRCGNGFYDAVGKAVFNYNLKLYLRQKVDNIFGPPLQFGVALLTAKAFGFGNGDTRDANFVQRFFHLVQFEWLDDRFDLFHGFSLYGA